MGTDQLKRLRDALLAHKEASGKSWRELGEEWDVSYASLCNLANGRRGISLTVALTIAGKLRIKL